MKDIVKYLIEREVKHLIHFTPESNLAGIKKEGVVSRYELEVSNHHSFTSLDSMRLDEHRNMSCFSLSFPNYMMMYRYRKELCERDSDVALLFIKVEKLLQFSDNQVLFYPTNAASSEFRHINREDLQGLPAVEKLFAEEARTKAGQIFSRSAAKLPAYLTTDPQAEVMISARIPWDCISFVVAHNFERKRALENLDIHPYIYGGWKVEKDPNLDVFKFPTVWEPWHRKEEL